MAVSTNAPRSAALAGARRGRRIDVHYHALPEASRDWVIKKGWLDPAKPETWPRWAQWTLDDALKVMDANGIAVGVASLPLASEFLKERALAAEATRVFNDSMADLVKSHPRRFGHFAYLPVSHVDLARAEAVRALDELGADGVLLMAHAADGTYLGDRAFDPLFAELDRRRAVVLVHPSWLPGEFEKRAVPALDSWVADYMLDTTRAALNMIATGTLARFPNVSIILSHAGGFLPYAAGRAQLAGRLGEGPRPADVERALARFYYDTAQPMSPYATPSLLNAAGAGRILFGSDYPAVPATELPTLVTALERDKTLTPADRLRIDRTNALHLLPRLATRL
ncbi:amidohydrolase family protein [Spirillospora sp. CA-294931]|uniref:amidohydrolase family protein n=1 Tax=Spirillospora sp. CA-294931 TaxID=3240042 RepID=UPI003D92F6EB